MARNEGFRESTMTCGHKKCDQAQNKYGWSLPSQIYEFHTAAESTSSKTGKKVSSLPYCHPKSLFKQILHMIACHFFPDQVNGEIFTWGATVPTQRALAGSFLLCCNLEACRDYEDAKEKKLRRRRKSKEDSVICGWSEPTMPKYVLPVSSNLNLNGAIHIHENYDHIIIPLT